MSAELTELAELWSRFAEQAAGAEPDRARGIFLIKADGSGEMLAVDHEGGLRTADFSAENLAYQSATPLKQCISMLRLMCKDADRPPGQRTYPLPQSIDRVRALLGEAGLDAPEVHIWEVYTTSAAEKGA
jgi:hypothetical protein